MKKLFTSVLVFFMAGTPILAKNYALVMGVPSGFPPNSGIEIDMSLMKGLLQDYNYNIQTLKDPRPKDLERVLNSYSDKLTPNDNFIFYYSGHGAQVPDKNGDEADKRDEVICLKEKVKGELMHGDWSSLLVDDEMYRMLFKINAKKFVFFDSCHSGTAFKSASSTIAKTLGYFPNYIASKGAEIQPIPVEQTEAKASLMFFGAAKDGTSAQATSQGSMFTLSLIDGLKRKKADLNKDGKITFKELEKFTAKNIIKLCRNNPDNIFTPEMHAESFDTDADVISTLKSSSNDQQNANSSPSELEVGLDGLLSDGLAFPLAVSSKKQYKENESIKLHIDTGDNKAYLYVIYTDAKEHTILYPNKYAPKSKQVSGKIVFPSSSLGRFRLAASKPYGRTVVYVLLSEEPLNIYDKGMDGVFNSFGKNSPKSIALFRGVKVKSTKIFIGKTVFDVSP